MKTTKYWAIAASILLLALSVYGITEITTEQPQTTSAEPAQAEPLLITTAREIDEFGDVILEAKDIDLSYGDSLTVSFSGGHIEEAIAFYPDFFGNKGDTILCDYYDHLCIGGINCEFNKTAHINHGEEVTITLDERGKYLDLFNAFNIGSGEDRWPGQTEEQFINARSLSGGTMKEGIVYRSTSPFYREKKAGVAKYLEEHNIRFILDFADSPEDIKTYEDLPEYTQEIVDSGNIVPAKYGIDYTDHNTKDTIGMAIKNLLDHEGPYLIQCNLGRDRTGIVSSLLEALCGATYDEIVSDYMLSYYNLYQADMDPSSLQYSVFRQKLNDVLTEMYGLEAKELPEADLELCARAYLKTCGLSDEELDALRNRLEGK